MLGRFNHSVSKLVRAFSDAKKPKMELTIRTPYATFLKNHSGFSRMTAKTNEAVVVIQNITPACVHVLPPGKIKVNLTEDAKTSGVYMHTGGWLTVHPNNTCEINLYDGCELSEVEKDLIAQGEEEATEDTVAGKYTEIIQNKARISFTGSL